MCIFVSDGGSVYLKAMAYGIDRVLDSYRQKLVEVERKVKYILYSIKNMPCFIYVLDSFSRSFCTCTFTYI